MSETNPGGVESETEASRWCPSFAMRVAAHIPEVELRPFFVRWIRSGPVRTALLVLLVGVAASGVASLQREAQAYEGTVCCFGQGCCGCDEPLPEDTSRGLWTSPNAACATHGATLAERLGCAAALFESGATDAPSPYIAPIRVRSHLDHDLPGHTVACRDPARCASPIDAARAGVVAHWMVERPR